MKFDRAGLVLAAAAATPLLWFAKPDFVESGATWLLIATIWVGLVPWHLHLRGSRPLALPFLPLVTMFYIVFFALPPFVIEPAWWAGTAGTADDPYGVNFHTITTFTAALVLIGVAAIVGTYYALQPALRALPVSLRLPRDVPWPRVSIVLWVISAAHVVFLYLPVLRANSSLSQIMTPLGFFAVGSLFVAWQKGRLRDAEKLAYWVVLIPLQVLVHVYEGLITPIILLFLFLLTLYWSLSRKLGVVMLLAFFFALYIFPILKLSNLFIVENSPTVMSRVSDKISAVGMATILFSEGTGRDQHHLLDAVAGKNVIAPIVRRISLIVLLQYCVDQTPAQIPFLGGETLKNLLTNPVPRFLWKEKPTEVMGQWFGHKYRILTPADDRTSINLPWIVEFYINFGWVGVALGMAVVGGLLALLERMLLRPEMSELEVLAGWALLFRLFYQESNLSLMLGGFILQVVSVLALLYAILWIVARIPSPATRP